jgi:hypothetical protein
MECPENFVPGNKRDHRMSLEKDFVVVPTVPFKQR